MRIAHYECAHANIINMDNCGCHHCDCDDEKKDNKTADDKFSALKKDIENLGYKVEDVGEGEVKISNS